MLDEEQPIGTTDLDTDHQHIQSPGGGFGGVGKAPVTARLAPRSITTQIFLSVGDVATATALGESLRGGTFVQRERDGNGVAADAESAVDRASRGSGSPLPGEVRQKFESCLDTDLSGVRVHTGAESAQATQAVGARAYATGQDIHFAPGQYDPHSTAGQHLLAHEVAHTVQQRGGSTERQNKLEVSSPEDPAETEADRAADAMVAGAQFGVVSAGPKLARVKELSEAGDQGAQTMVEDVLPNSAMSKIDNVTDKNTAQALIRLLAKEDPLIDKGIATGQIETSVKITNSQIMGMLESYLTEAEGQRMNMTTFYSLFAGLTSDMGRLNGMMGALDLGSLKDLKDKDSSEEKGDKLLNNLFGGGDINKLKETAMKVDKSIGADFDKMEGMKAAIGTHGDLAQQAAATANADIGALSADQRVFASQASMIKNPEAQAKIAAAKKAAENDVAGKLQGVLKDALIAGVMAAPGGPKAAGAAAGKEAAKSGWKNVGKPMAEKFLKESDMKVGVMPDNTADKDAAKADAEVWKQLVSLETKLAAHRDKVRNQLAAFGSHIELYEQAREAYKIHMIETGRKMDAALASSQKKQPTREELCKQVCGNDPPPKPTPEAKSKPRFETVMQFVAEADRFLAQAAATEKQGQDQLALQDAEGVKKDNNASRAHEKLEALSKGADRPKHYFVINQRPNSKDKEKPFLFAQQVPFTFNHGANPSTQLAPGQPNEAQTHGSAEGGAFGANANIKAQLEQIPKMSEKISSFRGQVAGAVGL